jgi:hypothetical protein
LKTKVSTIRQAYRRDKVKRFYPIPLAKKSKIKMLFAQAQFLESLYKFNSKKSLQKAAAEVNAHFSSDSEPTKKSSHVVVKRYFNMQGNQMATFFPKPMIGSLNLQRRLDFAEQYIQKEEKLWQKTLWSDEINDTAYLKKRKISV